MLAKTHDSQDTQLIRLMQLIISGHKENNEDAILTDAAQFEKHNPTKSKQAPNPTNKTD